jgi:hypothetical protein
MRKTLPATKQRSRTIGKTTGKTAGKPAGKTAMHIRTDHGLEFTPPW